MPPGIDARTVLQEQFDLFYYSQGGAGYSDTETMPIYERRALYDMLIEAKKKEAEAYKNATKKRGGHNVGGSIPDLHD